MGLSLHDLDRVRAKIEEYLREKQNALAAYAAFSKEVREFIVTGKNLRETIGKEINQAKTDVATEKSEVREYDRVVRKNLDHERWAFEKYREEVATQTAAALREREEVIRKALEEKTACFPWVADAISRYNAAKLAAEADRLQSTQHAPKAAETVRKCKALVKQYKEESEVARFRVRYYEALFPWLDEYVDVDIDEALVAIGKPIADEFDDSSDEDPVVRWISKGEFAGLSVSERNQRALDNWRRSRQKSNWQIGRDYERFVGQRYEHDGYRVEYKGALEGLEDMGRDVIATRHGEVIIVQCKYWSSVKTIHEKHVFQLYGSCVEYMIDKNLYRAEALPLLFSHKRDGDSCVKPVLVTSTLLSPRAKHIAGVLGVQVVESLKLDPEYPIIKCNMSRATGEKIYHLPFDQQYDTTVVEFHKGEFYARSVQEAESRGFRRAWRYRSSRLAALTVPSKFAALSELRCDCTCSSMSPKAPTSMARFDSSRVDDIAAQIAFTQKSTDNLATSPDHHNFPHTHGRDPLVLKVSNTASPSPTRVRRSTTTVRTLVDFSDCWAQYSVARRAYLVHSSDWSGTTP